MKRPLFLLTVACLLTGCGGSGIGGSGATIAVRQFPLSSLGRTQITANGNTLNLWIADTQAKRNEGLMFVTDAEVQNDEGMIFAYPDEAQRFFYDKDTPLALDIAFLDHTGTVVSISNLVPYDLTTVGSLYPAQYAIELKRGTLARVGIVQGTHLSLPAAVTGN